MEAILIYFQLSVIIIIAMHTVAVHVACIYKCVCVCVNVKIIVFDESYTNMWTFNFCSMHTD